MSQLTVDQIQAAIVDLPQHDRQLLQQWLNQADQNTQFASLPPLDVIPPFQVKRVPPIFPEKDMSGEKLWIKENSSQYAGQWVALDGNRLIKAGRSAKEVHDAAKAMGIPLPLVLLVESPDALPFAGF